MIHDNLGNSRAVVCSIVLLNYRVRVMVTGRSAATLGRRAIVSRIGVVTTCMS
jgi:hypothetical protein